MGRSSAGNGSHTPTRRRALGVRAVLLAVVAAAGVWLALHLGLGPTASPAPVVANFDGLVDTGGRPFVTAQYTGRYKLLAYGYTSCPDACPATLTKLHAVLNSVADAAAPLLPLFVTLDPAHDTAEVLGAYVQHFDARIVGLTGDREQLQRSATRLNALPMDPAAAQTPDGGPNHAVRLYLLAPDNTLLRTYELTDPTPLIVSDVRRYLPTGG